MTIFVYGTLLIDEIWSRVTLVPRHRLITYEALLLDYERKSLRNRTYPGIVPKRGAQLTGLVCQGISPEVIKRLDAFEGPEYKRTLVEIRKIESQGEQEETVWTYVLKEELHRDLPSEQEWSLESFVKNGYDDFVRRFGGWEQL